MIPRTNTPRKMLRASFTSALAVLLRACYLLCLLNVFLAMGKTPKPRGNKAKNNRKKLEKLSAKHVLLRAVKTAAPSTFAAPNAGMPSPFCLRGATNSATSVNHRPTAHPVHVNQLSFSVGGSNHVQWVSGVGVLFWSQHT